jgi:hypothetical protein
MRREIMARTSSYLVGGLAVIATMIVALPAAQGIGASTKELPVVSVNRTSKGDRMASHQSFAIKQTPSEVARDSARAPIQPQGKPKLLDGCEPMFSPVTVPSMAHLAGRCFG